MKLRRSIQTALWVFAFGAFCYSSFLFIRALTPNISKFSPVPEFSRDTHAADGQVERRSILLGIHSVPERMENRAFMRLLIKTSFPSSFSYEFVFSFEGISPDWARLISMESTSTEDCLVLNESSPFSNESHWKTIRWLQHTVKTKPWIKYIVKTDDDSLVIFPMLNELILKLDRTREYIYFGREYFNYYMLGQLYGMTTALAEKIASNFSGVILMEDKEKIAEDLLTGHWMVALRKNPEILLPREQNRFKEFYKGVKRLDFKRLDVLFVDWGKRIGHLLEDNHKLWSTPIFSETVVIHGLKNLSQMTNALGSYCKCNPNYFVCPVLLQDKTLKHLVETNRANFSVS